MGRPGPRCTFPVYTRNLATGLLQSRYPYGNNGAIVTANARHLQQSLMSVSPGSAGTGTINGSGFGSKSVVAPLKFLTWAGVSNGAAAAGQFDATEFVNYASPSTNFISEVGQGIGGTNCLRMNLNMVGVGEMFPHHQFNLGGIDFFVMSYWLKANRLTANSAGGYGQFKGGRAGVAAGGPVENYYTQDKFDTSYISGVPNNLDTIGIESHAQLNGNAEAVNYGTGNATPVLFDGNWHFIKIEMQMNTVGQSNAISRIWMDGIQVLNRTNSAIRDSSGQHFDFLQHNPGWANDLASNNWLARETRHYIDVTRASIFRINASSFAAATGEFNLTPTAWSDTSVSYADDVNAPAGFNWICIRNASNATQVFAA